MTKKKDNEYYFKKYSIPMNKETLKCMEYNITYFNENNLSMNISSFFTIIRTMLETYHPLPLFERFKKFRNINHQSRTLEKYQLRYGIKEGTERFNQYCSKQALSNTFEYKRDKHGWTKEQFNEYNMNRAVTLRNCIEKHGVEEGKKIFEDYCNKQSYVGCKKEYFIEKYGLEDGEKKYRDINKMKVLTIDNFIRKYGLEEGEKKYREYCYKKAKSLSITSTYSKISQKLFDELKYLINDDENVFYATHNKERSFYDDISNSYGFIDFVYKNKAIEFYGDFWHLNPKTRSKNDYVYINNKKYLMEDLHERDKKRIDILRRLGYDVLVIWENDYCNNKENVIKQCMEFINA